MKDDFVLITCFWLKVFMENLCFAKSGLGLCMKLPFEEVLVFAEVARGEVFGLNSGLVMRLGFIRIRVRGEAVCWLLFSLFL